MKHILLATLTATASLTTAETYHLYFLGGQSNMVGFGDNSELPADLNKAVPDTRIFLGDRRDDFQPADGVGLWTTLTPGFGAGARTDGATVSTSNRFGPELTFATRLRELRPDEPIAIIKYAKGGTSIDARQSPWGTWDPHDTRAGGPDKDQNPGVNQYDHALATISSAIRTADIDNDGEPDTLIPAGIVWMQGETDAGNPDTAADYAANLTELLELLRAAMHADDLPVVLGRISDSRLKAGHPNPQWKHGDIVRANQARVADADPRATLVTSTDAYGYSDPAHYDTAGYLDMGVRFAEALAKLRASD